MSIQLSMCTTEDIPVFQMVILNLRASNIIWVKSLLLFFWLEIRVASLICITLNHLTAKNLDVSRAVNVVHNFANNENHKAHRHRSWITTVSKFLLNEKSMCNIKHTFATHLGFGPWCYLFRCDNCLISNLSHLKVV